MMSQLHTGTSMLNQILIANCWCIGSGYELSLQMSEYVVQIPRFLPLWCVCMLTLISIIRGGMIIDNVVLGSFMEQRKLCFCWKQSPWQYKLQLASGTTILIVDGPPAGHFTEGFPKTRSSEGGFSEISIFLFYCILSLHFGFEIWWPEILSVADHLLRNLNGRS